MRSFHATRQVQCNADRQIGRASGRYSFHSPLVPTETGQTREEPEREDRARRQTRVARSSLRVFRSVPARLKAELQRAQRNDKSPGLSPQRFASEEDWRLLAWLLRERGAHHSQRATGPRA